MKIKAGLVAISLATAALAFGQGNIMDIGMTTAGVEISENDTVWVDEESAFDIYFENDDTVAGYSTGFVIWSQDGTEWQWIEELLEIQYIPGTFPPEFDSIWSIVTTVEGSRQYPPSVVWDNGGLERNLADTNGAPFDSILFGGTRKNRGMVAGPLEKQVQIHFIATEPTSGLISTICIDSAKIGAAGDFVFADVAGTTTAPTVLWPAGGRCYPVKKEGAASPPIIVLNPTQIGVTGIIGTYTPSASITVTNGGIGTMNWTATNKESWLTLTPDHGINNGTINLSFDLTGLDEGFYIDTVLVSSPEAINSPQAVQVALTVVVMPPIIKYEPSEFFASAVVGGTNPEDKYLHIWTDVVASELNWTVTNSQSWLTLSPPSGVSHDSVTLQFDVSGLAYGMHYDTIVITDPEATNSPQRVPVTLQMVSDLPVLAFDPDTLHLTILGGTIADPLVVTVYNEGEGIMTYEATEACSWIMYISPASGTAPQEVSLSLKTFPLGIGDYYCTVTFTSPEAINSPQDLVVHLHITNDPAMISLVPGEITLERYECWQGYDEFPKGLEASPSSFEIINVGSDPMNWWITHTAPWLIVFPTSGTDYEIVSLILKKPDVLPAGTYVDTIVVHSHEAFNSPETLLVTLNIMPGPEDPEIITSKPAIDIPAQEVYGTLIPILGLGDIYNKNPGCMEFWIDENLPWLKFLADTADAPHSLQGFVEIGSYTYGLYPGVFHIWSETAVNSPLAVDVNLIVWRYRGDANWDNRVNVADVVYLMNHIFLYGPQPYPENRVGDVNCDGNINIADVVYIMNYIFDYGPEPCGTPKK